MSEQKPEKLTANTTPEKPRPQQPFVQLTEEQLEGIAGGFTGSDSSDCNHNQSLVSIKEVIKSQPPPEKSRPQQPFVQLEGKLTEAQLEAIAGGGIETLTFHRTRGSDGG